MAFIALTDLIALSLSRQFDSHVSYRQPISFCLVGKPIVGAVRKIEFKLETRKKVIQALEMLETKRDKNPPKKPGNIPL
jgi:hypothetical protein